MKVQFMELRKLPIVTLSADECPEIDFDVSSVYKYDYISLHLLLNALTLSRYSNAIYQIQNKPNPA